MINILRDNIFSDVIGVYYISLFLAWSFFFFFFFLFLPNFSSLFLESQPLHLSSNQHGDFYSAMQQHYLIMHLKFTDQCGFSHVNIINSDIAIDNILTVDIDKLINIYHNTELKYWDWYWYQLLIMSLKNSHTIKQVTQLS